MLVRDVGLLIVSLSVIFVVPRMLSGHLPNILPLFSELHSNGTVQSPGNSVVLGAWGVSWCARGAVLAPCVSSVFVPDSLQGFIHAPYGLALLCSYVLFVAFWF